MWFGIIHENTLNVKYLKYKTIIKIMEKLISLIFKQINKEQNLKIYQRLKFQGFLNKIENYLIIFQNKEN